MNSNNNGISVQSLQQIMESQTKIQFNHSLFNCSSFMEFLKENMDALDINFRQNNYYVTMKRNKPPGISGKNRSVEDH